MAPHPLWLLGPNRSRRPSPPPPHPGIRIARMKKLDAARFLKEGFFNRLTCWARSAWRCLEVRRLNSLKIQKSTIKLFRGEPMRLSPDLANSTSISVRSGEAAGGPALDEVHPEDQREGYNQHHDSDRRRARVVELFELRHDQ